MLLHIGAFRLDIDSEQQSVWHSLSPQSRLLSVLLLVFAIALTPNGHWLTWLCYGVVIGAIVWISRVTLLELGRRVGVELIFVGVVVLGTAFRDGGSVVWQWGWLHITTGGLTVLGSVVLKMLLSLTLLNVLILTTSIPALFQALLKLRMPPILVAIMATMYRYLAVLVEELQSMQRAAVSRNLTANRNWQRLIVGNMIGALFIRTYERGERVHQAMVARGYSGLPPIADVAQGGWQDGVAVAMIGAIALLGQLFPFLLRWLP